MKITAITDTVVKGEVVGNGVIPDEGEIIEGIVDDGQAHVGSEDGYPIQISESASASGSVTVRVDAITPSEIQGSVLHNDGIPNVDDEVHAKIGHQKKLAKAFSGDYDIHLRKPHPIGLNVVVRITQVNEDIYGKVVRQDTKRVYGKDDEFEEPDSKDDLINRGKL